MCRFHIEEGGIFSGGFGIYSVVEASGLGFRASARGILQSRLEEKRSPFKPDVLKHPNPFCEARSRKL